MSKRNSTVEIVDGKVVFSEEVLSYFESIRNEENSEWIDKYFEYLSDDSNLTATKYNLHHIRPCCTFKDEEHKNRSETQPLGNEFKENIIKLSIYNHLFAHYYLWKIFDNEDSKVAFQRMCGQKQYIDNLTENELKEIAKLKQECAKENQTEEERKEYEKQYKEEKYKNNKEKILEQQKEYNNAFCYDPINNTPCTRNTLNLRKRNNKEKYKNVVVSECLISEEDYLKLKEEISKKKKEEKKLYSKKWYENNKEQHSKTGKLWYEKNKDELSKKRKIYRKSNKENISKRGKEYYKNNKEEISEKHKKYNNQLCIDPTNGTKCTLGTLRSRKCRNKEEYQNVIPRDCIIKNNEINA